MVPSWPGRGGTPCRYCHTPHMPAREDAPILVAYASKHGSTQAVADRVGEVLSRAALEVDVRRTKEVRDLAGYRAVVLGAPIYNGRWHHHARRFLERHRPTLSALPVAIFALGPRTADQEAWRRSQSQFDRALGEFPWLSPQSTQLFGGADPPKGDQETRRRDVRDWPAIEAWAQAQAQLLQFHPGGS